MKLYFDTNVVIDILERREPHYKSSNEVFEYAIDNKIDCVIGVSSITDIYYILNKKQSDSKKVIKIIFDILEFIRPVDVLAGDIYNAVKYGFADFEDAVVAATADREQADYIITRNTVDYTISPVPAISPADFLSKHLPTEAPQ
jgi:predicted nucleic acid-binding protein